MPDTKAVETQEAEPEAKESPKAKVLGSIKSARLHFGRVKPVQSVHRTMFADIPAGTDFKTVLRPEYWAHQTRELRPLDLIEMFCEDGTWEALCRVMQVGEVEAKLSPIYFVQHETQSADDSDEYEVKYISPSIRYVVRRRDTNAILKDHLQTKSAAYDWLQRHLKDMKA